MKSNYICLELRVALYYKKYNQIPECVEVLPLRNEDDETEIDANGVLVRYRVDCNNIFIGSSVPGFEEHTIPIGQIIEESNYISEKLLDDVYSIRKNKNRKPSQK